MEYLERFPLAAEARLELALSVLRSLPQGAGPEQALAALQPLLPVPVAGGGAPLHPALTRSPMPEQYMGRPRKGVRGFVARWSWLAFIAVLLGLTLYLSVPR